MHVTHHHPMAAGAAIAAYRFVEVKANDNEAHQAASNAAKIVGTSGRSAIGSGETADVAVAGISEIQAGAAVTRGDLLTSDANGKAIPAAAGQRIGGIAMAIAVAEDIFDILLSPGVA